MKTPPEVRMLSPEQAEALLIRAAAGTLTADDVVVIRQTFATLAYIISLLHQKQAQVKTLLKRIFGIKSEKSQKVQQQLKSTDLPSIQKADSTGPKLEEKAKGHARRKFVEVASDFPDECLYVIVDVFGKIYQFDAQARQQNLSEEERLKFHQQKSGPVMTAFHDWMCDQFASKRVEPNSTLGKAIGYVLKHWDPFSPCARSSIGQQY